MMGKMKNHYIWMVENRPEYAEREFSEAYWEWMDYIRKTRIELTKKNRNER